MALASRRQRAAQDGTGGESNDVAVSAPDPPPAKRKRAHGAEPGAVSASAGNGVDAGAPPTSKRPMTNVAVPPPPSVPRKVQTIEREQHQSEAPKKFVTMHRDYISAHRPGKRVGASAAYAAAAEPLRCSNDDVDEARIALMALPPRRANAKAQRRAAIEARFPQWREWMRRGHSVLLYGFGSKRSILDRFASTTPASACGGVLVADGGASGASGRGLATAAARALGVSSRGRNAAATSGGGRAASAALEALAAVDASESSARRLLVAVHNIDKMSSSDADTAALASLASCRCVRLVATADHANAPLLWDKRASSLFAWRWVDATTFAPPAALDASRAPALLGGGAAGGAEEDGGFSAAMAVLGALVPNARAVFCLLAEAQLAAMDALREAAAAASNGRANVGAIDFGAVGVPFDHLFRAARERFVAPTEPALRAHLAEFRDHGLLLTRRGGGGGIGAAAAAPGQRPQQQQHQQGGDDLAIPLRHDVLARVLDEASAYLAL